MITRHTTPQAPAMLKIHPIIDPWVNADGMPIMTSTTHPANPIIISIEEVKPVF
jgi:hypothetical protein